MAVSKEMWLKGLHSDAAKMKANARDERDKRVVEITRKWRDGYKALKEENDRLQKESQLGYVKEMEDVDAWLSMQINKGPPKD